MNINQVRVSVVGTSGVDAMLVAYNLPELGSDLVAALASLDMDDFTHGCLVLGLVWLKGLGVFGCSFGTAESELSLASSTLPRLDT